VGPSPSRGAIPRETRSSPSSLPRNATKRVRPVEEDPRAPRFATTRSTSSPARPGSRSEEHTSELQSRENLVCRLLLEKNNNQKRGLQVFDKTELLKVEEKKGFNLVHLDTKATIKAKHIIYCIGYESANLIKEKFVDLLSTYAIVSEVNQKLYFFNDTATTEIYTLSLHDALPI